MRGVKSLSLPLAIVVQSPEIQTSALPNAREGEYYSASVAATGFASPEFRVSTGNLPEGLTLDRVSGHVTGVPRSTGAHQFTIEASNPAGIDAQELTLFVDPQLTRATAPRIEGLAVIGSILTAIPGEWEPQPVSLSYRWLRGVEAIEGATSSTYEVTQSDFNTRLRVEVTGSKPGYVTQTLQSSQTSTVGWPLSLGTSVPSISGEAQVGATLRAIAGNWGPSPLTLSYRWFRGQAEIVGATAATYSVGAADESHRISVAVTGIKPGYTTVTLVSPQTDPVRPMPSDLTSTAAPTITGLPYIGATLTANTVAWQPAPVALAHQWIRNDEPIPGATAPTYLVGPDDYGSTIRVEVTGSRSGYVSQTITSDPTPIVVEGPRPRVERWAGADRYATSAAISAASFEPGVEVAYIASGSGFADALSGAPVAGATGGPVLLVPTGSIPAVIQNELNRLQPKRIVVLGGPGAVSASVMTQLEATFGAVERWAGARYATSAAISAASFEPGVEVAYIASGSGSTPCARRTPVAGATGGPVLLVPTGTHPCRHSKRAEQAPTETHCRSRWSRRSLGIGDDAAEAIIRCRGALGGC